MPPRALLPTFALVIALLAGCREGKPAEVSVDAARAADGDARPLDSAHLGGDAGIDGAPADVATVDAADALAADAGAADAADVSVRDAGNADLAKDGGGADTAKDAGGADGNADAHPQGCVRAEARTFANLRLAPSLRRSSLVLDETTLYVSLDGVIWSFSKANGHATAELVVGQANVHALALHEGYLYYTTIDSLRRLPAGGGAPETLASGLAWPSEPVFDQSSVYWAEHGEQPGWRGRVARVPKAGGQVTVVVEGVRGTGVVVDGAHVYYLVGGGGPTRDGFFKTSIEGGLSSTLHHDGIAAHALKANATHLFGLLYNEVVRVDKGGGGPAVTFPARSIGGYALAMDATHVYWTIQGLDGGVPDPHEGGRLMRAPQAGGVSTNFTNCLSKPSAVAVDATHVYWVEGYTGEIKRAPK